MAAQLNQKNLSSLQIASFCTQLSLLIKAGISLQEGIHILYEDASSQAEKELLKQILEPIEASCFFSQTDRRISTVYGGNGGDR